MKAIGIATLGHQVKYVKSIINSISRDGHECKYIQSESTTRRCNLENELKNYYDFAVCWGMGNFARLRRYNVAKNVIIIENSYLNNVQSKEKVWVSCGWNGLNGRANFCNKNSPSDRWIKHFNDGRMLDYSDGEYILIPLQINRDASIRNLGFSYQNIVNEIRKFTDLPIKIKQHPTQFDGWDEIKGKNISYIDRMMPIQNAIKNAKVVVTINSNAGVDAVLGGKPVITLDKGSMVYDISAHSFEKINLPDWPDRTQWGYDIAYAQWHPTEIENGEAWNHLKQGI